MVGLHFSDFFFTDSLLSICKEKPKMQFYIEKMILFRKPTPRTADSGCLVVVSRETKMVILDGRSVFFDFWQHDNFMLSKKSVYLASTKWQKQETSPTKASNLGTIFMKK